MSSLDIDRQPSLEWPAAPVPAWPTHATLSGAVQQCRACELWEGATHAVIGQGAVHARVMLVAEHPGDREDIEGHPFAAPRGRVLDHGLAFVSDLSAVARWLSAR